jgi:hypothetical protein
MVEIETVTVRQAGLEAFERLISADEVVKEG